MAESNPDRSTGPPNSQGGRRLDSWKEIAAYLNRDVTTVRRWEKREGLPVHRHQHSALGSVYAFTTDIDSWLFGREHPIYREEPSSPHEIRPRLVDRDNELRRLHEHLARALEVRRETVFIAGELGIGKTALTQTFLDQAGPGIWVAAGQCVEQYGKGEPYLPILEGLERIIRDSRYPDAIKVVREHAPSWLDQFSLRSQLRGRRHRDHSVGPTPGQMAGELTDAIEALAGVRPLVLLLEDLHWSDQATVEFIARLARRPDRARLLVIGTYRPSELFDSGSPLLRVGRELRVHFQAHEIEVQALTQDAVGELIARDRTWKDLRGTAASLRQWSGNPLFLVHFLEHLESSGRIVERDGAWYLDLDPHGRIIPNSLRMLVEEQVDRLKREHRRLLEIASVVGETFSAALVAHTAQQDVTLVERLFEDLCKRSHLVTHREAAGLPDGTASAAYTFVHEFCRQVVYERLPTATLMELHRRIGTQLELVYGGHASEISSELAMHFDRGHDFTRAVNHYWIAAQNALARNADREAQILLSKASELVVQLSSGDDHSRMELHLRAQLGAVLGRLAQNIGWMNADFEEEIETARGSIGEPELVDALIRLSRFHSVSGDLIAAREIGDRAAVIGHRRGRALFEAIAQQAYVRLLTGEFAASRSLVVEALAVADHGRVSESNRERTRCSIVLAWTSWYLGLYSELRRSVEGILSNTDADRLAAVGPSLAPLFEWLGETDRSLVLLRSRRGVESRSSLLGAPWPTEAVYGWLLARRRRVTQGVGILRENAQKLRTLAMHSWLPYTLVWLAESLKMNAQIDEALAAAEEGLNVVRRTGARCCDAELYRVRGEAMIARKRPPSAAAPLNRNRDAAEASFWAGITVARQQDARTLELRTTLSLCRLLRDAGRHQEAIRALAPVCELFGSADDTPDLAEARKLLSEGAA
jgi:hypothetical protein